MWAADTGRDGLAELPVGSPPTGLAGIRFSAITSVAAGWPHTGSAGQTAAEQDLCGEGSNRGAEPSGGRLRVALPE